MNTVTAERPAGGTPNRRIVRDGLLRCNPVTCQMLGICSCLAVTTSLDNALVMATALALVLTCSNVAVSLLRMHMPHRIRMMVEVAIIATLVICFDQVLKALSWDMSRRLGPYVGLIITNCIIMGRAEAFAAHNGPWRAAVDGLANGAGYGFVLVLIAVFRELLGTGKLVCFGRPLPWSLAAGGYEPNVLMAMAPGAFLTMGVLIWIVNAVVPHGEQGDR
jgi:Na+-transporting NADH:ubiquinone oxidoreductase subunit D